MSLKQRLLLLSSSITIALLLSLAWISTAFAAGGDGDGDVGGFGADDLILPAIIVGGLLLIGIGAFVFSRRNRISRGG